MKILFTGASSFTGMWFVKELVQNGHSVSCTFQRQKGAYEGVRQKRVEQLLSICNPVFSCPFGSDAFLDLIDQNHYDLFCHHAADVTNYKEPDFDFIMALDRNTKNISLILDALKKNGCNKVALTGSLFEQNGDLRAVSAYGLSKGLTAQVFRYFCEIKGMKLGQFVIPTPFGPYEEPRFTNYLMQTWFKKEKAAINQPDYIRDNIHISLLAKSYTDFVTHLEKLYQELRPSQYAESNGDFAKRLAHEMQKRLSISCEIELKTQTEFPEPKKRVNRDILSLDWNESQSWDAFADYYASLI